MAGDSGIDFDDLHGTIMIISWFALTQAAVWSTFFKQYHPSINIHIALGAMTILLVAVGSTIILTHDQFDYEWNERGYHNGLGAILFYISPILLFSGAFGKYTKGEPVKPGTVKKTSYAHRIIGWIFILASRVPLYTGQEDEIAQFPTLFFIIFDAISYTLFWLLKLRPSSVHKTTEISPGSIREVSKEEELGVYGQNYFIFANIVYPIERVFSSHPGGSTVIDRVRGREVDRFIYGGQFVEQFSDQKPHSHSTQSLTLADDPLAEIKIRSPYRHMGPLNSVVIDSMKRVHNSTEVYLLYLSGTDIPFEYQGYSQIEQLGRFYSLTANNKITRLYSPVNFACKSNIQLMKKIMGDVKIFEEARQMSMATNREQTITELVPKSERDSNAKDGLLPLMIKKYPEGRFTSDYLQVDQKELCVSQPLGFGLSLASFAPGKIVMFSGGTGFYPFSDLIDLLYKSVIVEEGSMHSKQLLENDPILSQKPFASYTFELHCSVRNVNEIHPISLNQINKLTENKKLKCCLKATIQDKTQFQNVYKGIEVRNSRFEQVIEDLGKSSDVSGILICGPGKMSNGIVQELIKRGINPSKWRVL